MHDSLRHCFANALIHYQLLIQEVDAEVQHLAHVTLRSVDSETDLDDDELGVLRLDESTPLKSHKYINAQHTTSIPKEAPLADSSPALLPSSSGTPSEYLQSRCPLCFGGTNSLSPELLAQCIICLDVNFQLKRKFNHDMQKGREGQRGLRDPQCLSLHTIILEQAFVEHWQDITEKVYLS